ncbi:eCIS core domain-containing protein [Winogradskyella sp.]|uniref:eCIS core domain-containing protein n=1 Tax=Winogradskyella sp. TaxID=1883156 RepID=UPI003BA98C06
MQVINHEHTKQSKPQSKPKVFVQASPISVIQKKLAIGSAHDAHEVEADSMADKVVGMSDSHIHAKQHSGPSVQRKCAAYKEEMVQRKSLVSEITPMVQRKSHNSEAGTASQALTQQINSSKGNGHSLDKGTQSFMESRFGTDFSGVRIHTDTQAIQMSRDLNAQAFTVGNDIYFNEGKYNPNSNSGKHLLAHELTHTLQQGEGKIHKKNIQRLTIQLQKQESDIDQRKVEPSNKCKIDHTAAPKKSILVKRLIDFGIISKGKGTEFTDILGRHVRENTNYGKQYIEYLINQAYPMPGFCLHYNGRGWNRMFRKIMRHYNISTPTHRAMRLIYSNVRDHDRKNLLMYADSHLYYISKSEGKSMRIRNPFAQRLTQRSLRKLSKDKMLNGVATEATLLMKATDNYLDTLTLTRENVESQVISPTLDNGAIFQWGSAKSEDSAVDPNTYDTQIVYWVTYYNRLFKTVDSKGNPNPLDPDLMKALIWRESRFNKKAVSSGKARGLTQVIGRERKGVAKYTAGISGFKTEQFDKNASLQIAVGVRILFQKYARSQNWETAVRDYNGSPHKEQYAKEVLEKYRSHKRTTNP